MKKILLICVLSLFAMLNSVIIAQNSGDYCIWIENDQPSNEFMKYVLEDPEAGETHTYSIYMDGDGIDDYGKYNLLLTVERRIEGSEWEVVSTDALFDYFLQTNVPVNELNSWYHLGNYEPGNNEDQSYIYPQPGYNAFDGNNSFDYFRGHFLKSSVNPIYKIDGKSRLRFGFEWKTLDFEDQGEYRVKLELQVRECMEAPLDCRDYEIYYDRDNRLAVGGHQSVNPDSVYTTYFQTLVRENVEANICYGDEFLIGKDENLNPYNLTDEAMAYADSKGLNYDNTPITFTGTYERYRTLDCGSVNIFDSVYDLSLNIHYVPDAPRDTTIIVFGDTYTMDIETIYPAIETGLQYMFYTADGIALENGMVTISDDATFQISKKNVSDDASCESEKATVTILLYPIPSVTINELDDVCPNTDQEATVVIDPATLRLDRGNEIVYTWTGVTPLVDAPTAIVDVNEVCGAIYDVTNQVTVTYFVEATPFIIESNIAEASFEANDTIAPVASERAITTPLFGCRSMIEDQPVFTTVAELTAGLEITISDNCTANEALVVTSTEVETVDSPNCKYTFVRTYAVTDACENSIDVIHTITIEDTVAPTIVASNPDFSVVVEPTMGANCAYKLQVEATEGIMNNFSITDNCASYTVENIADYLTFSYNETVIEFGDELNIPLDAYPVMIDMIMTDDCDNTFTAVEALKLELPAQVEITGIVASDNGPCITVDYTLTSTVVDGVAPYTYSWVINEEVVGTEASLTIPMEEVVPFTTTLTVTDANGCVDTEIFTADVMSKPRFEIGAVVGNDDCLDYTGSIEVIPVEDFYTFTLRMYDAETEEYVVVPETEYAFENNVFSGLVHGKYRVAARKMLPTVDGLDFITCWEIIKNIEVADLRVYPTITLLEDESQLTVCDGFSNGYAKVAVAPVDSVRWFAMNADGIGTPVPAGNNMLVESLADGQYMVIAYHNNCTSELTIDVDSYDVVTPGSITTPTGVCENDILTVSNVEIAQGGFEGFDYTWFYSLDGAEFVECPGDNNQVNYSWISDDVTLQVGTYILKRQAVNMCATVFTLTEEIVVNRTYFDETLTDTIVLCANTFTWDANGETYEYTLATGGEQVFEDEILLQSVVTGCDSMAYLHLTLTPAPIVTLVSTSTVCFGTSTGVVEFSTTTEDIDDIKWFRMGEEGYEEISGNALTNTGLIAGTYMIKVYKNDCEGWATAEVTSYDDIFAGTIEVANTNICDNEGDLFTIAGTAADGGNGVFTYAWMYAFNGGVYQTAPGVNNELAYSWPETEELVAGTYNFKRTATNLCGTKEVVAADAINVYPTFEDATQIVAACDTYIWESNGLTYNYDEELVGAPQVINVTFEDQTIHGCDSIVSLELTLTPSYAIADAIEICEEELPYTYKGNEITLEDINLGGTETIVYEETTIYGCDSIVTLNITVNDSIVENYYYSVCADAGTFTFPEYDENVVTITADMVGQANESEYRYTTEEGCTKTVYLHLTVNPVYNELHNLAATCENELPIIFRGHEITLADVVLDEETTITYNGTTVAGCDSTVVVKVTVNSLPTVTPISEIGTICHSVVNEPIATVGGVITYKNVEHTGAGAVTFLGNTAYYSPNTADAGTTVNFTIIAQNGACEVAKENSLDVYTIPTITNVETPRIICMGVPIPVSVEVSEQVILTLTAYEVGNVTEDGQIATQSYTLEAGIHEVAFTELLAYDMPGNLVFTYAITDIHNCSTSTPVETAAIIYDSEMRLIVMEDRTLGDDNYMEVTSYNPFNFYVKVENECGTDDRNLQFQFDLMKKNQETGEYEIVECVFDELEADIDEKIILGVDGCMGAQNFDKDVFDYTPETENYPETASYPSDFFLPRPASWNYGNNPTQLVFLNSEYLINEADPTAPRIITVNFSGLVQEEEYYVHCRMYHVTNGVDGAQQNCSSAPIGGFYGPEDRDIELIAERNMYINVTEAGIPPVGNSTALENATVVAEMTVSPNPAISDIAVEVKNLEGEATFTISSVAGTVLDRTDVQLKGTTVIRRDVSSLKPGMYIIKVANENGVVTRKLVVGQ